MTVKVDVILDTISGDGNRLTTLEVTFPRIVATHILTHRSFSRNGASSRAIPVNKNIRYMMDDTVSPSVYGMSANGKGMHPKKGLHGWRYIAAEVVWKMAALSAAFHASLLSAIGLHKQWANRVIEPFSHTKMLISSTEWDNFFNLRIAGDAQDAMRHVAYVMQQKINASKPVLIHEGEWHAPYVGVVVGNDPELFDKLAVSVSQCAQVSFRSSDDSLSKAKRVVRSLLPDNGNIHASPFEHVATPNCTTVNNFHGFRQLRQAVEESATVRSLLTGA